MDKFEQDRKRAFIEIREAMGRKVGELARSTFGRNRVGRNLPDYIQVQEIFKWPARVINLTSSLENGSAVRDAFMLVAHPQPLDLSLPRTNGRDNAFDTILRALDIAERDFDATYKPLGKFQLDDWKNKTSLDEATLQKVWKENQRLFMKQSIADLRQDIKAWRAKPQNPAFKGGKPHP